MDQGEPCSTALKPFLACGPLLGVAALEPILVRRDKRRGAKARPLLPGRFGAGARNATHRRLRS